MLKFLISIKDYSHEILTGVHKYLTECHLKHDLKCNDKQNDEREFGCKLCESETSEFYYCNIGCPNYDFDICTNCFPILKEIADDLRSNGSI